MTVRGFALLILTLSLLLVPGRDLRAEAPAIDAQLSIDSRPVILEGWTRSFYLYYRFGTPLTQEEFRARFPETSNGGYQGNCGIRTLEGVRITLDEPLSWQWGHVWGDPPGQLPPSDTITLEPQALQALIYDETGPALLDHMLYQDLAMPTVYEGGRSDSRWFEIEALEFDGESVGWTATITFEAWCRYVDSSTGNVVATLTTSDLGGEPLTLTESGEDIPRYGVPVAGESWSAVKSLYRR